MSLVAQNGFKYLFWRSKEDTVTAMHGVPLLKQVIANEKISY